MIRKLQDGFSKLRTCHAVSHPIALGFSPSHLVRIVVHDLIKIASYSELRRNLAGMLDNVTADHEPVVITRDKGKPAAVLMSLEDFASFEETQYLLRNPDNAKRLLRSIAGVDGGQGHAKQLQDISEKPLVT